jgi:hypothetical protein
MAAKLVHEGFTPKNRAELRRVALEAYSNTLEEGAEPPSDDWAKPKIRKLWTALGL